MPKKQTLSDDKKAFMKAFGNGQLSKLHTTKKEKKEPYSVKSIAHSIKKALKESPNSKSRGTTRIIVNLVSQEDDMRMKTVASKEDKEERARISYNKKLDDAKGILKIINKTNADTLQNLEVKVDLVNKFGMKDEKVSPCSITFNGNTFTASDGNSLVEYTVINKLGSKNGFVHVKDRRGKESVAFIQLAQSFDPEKTTKSEKLCSYVTEDAQMIGAYMEGLRISNGKYYRSLVEAQILLEHKGTAFTEFEVLNNESSTREKLPISILIFEKFDSFLPSFKKKYAEDTSKLQKVETALEDLKKRLLEKKLKSNLKDDAYVVHENSIGGISVRLFSLVFIEE